MYIRMWEMEVNLCARHRGHDVIRVCLGARDVHFTSMLHSLYVHTDVLVTHEGTLFLTYKQSIQQLKSGVHGQINENTKPKLQQNFYCGANGYTHVYSTVTPTPTHHFWSYLLIVTNALSHVHYNEHFLRHGKSTPIYLRVDLGTWQNLGNYS